MSTATRAKHLLSRRGLAIAAVLGLVGVAALLGAASVYTNPTTETVVEQTRVQAIGVDTRTSAIVTGNSSLYERGDRLEDLPVYFLEATPNLTVTLVTSTPEGVDTSVTQQLVLVQEATRDGEPFFATNRTLIDATDRSTAGEVTAATEVNMSAIREEVSRVQAEIGVVGAYRARLELTVAYRTDAYEGALEAATPLVFTSGAYWLGGELAANREHSTPVTTEVTQPADPVAYGGLGLLGLLCLGLAGAVVYLREEIDLDTLPSEYYHEEYREWISEGEFPTSTDKRYISINTLEDLVDIAIDSQKRVIFDESLEVYSVVDGDLIYYFSRDPFSVDVWLDT